MNQHFTTLQAFARGHEGPDPTPDALHAALKAGLLKLTTTIQLVGAELETVNTWRLTSRGRAMLMGQLAMQAPVSLPRPATQALH